MSEDSRRPIAVVDIDGVLADVRHRLHHVRSRPKDWPAFFAAAPRDPVLPRGVDLVRELAHDHEIVYLSGRPEHCRHDTLAWFAEHDLPPGELVLRSNRDRRPARLTKMELIGGLTARGRVGVIVDDDALVVEAARAAGFQVVHADWMAESGPLTEAQEVDGAT